MAMTKEQRQEKLRELERKIASTKGIGAVYGLAKGLSITMKTMLRPAITAQYPHVKPDLPPRTRGIIALKEENCTVCMLCSRECPDWCIFIDSHKDVMPPKTPGARARTRNVLDRFAIDYALCMYCGICVEVCPFDALFWSPHFEYSTADIGEMTHEMETLGRWMEYVPAPPALEAGAEEPPELSKEDRIYGVVEEAAPAAAAPASEASAAEPEKPQEGTPAAETGPAPDSAEAAGAAQKETAEPPAAEAAEPSEAEPPATESGEAESGEAEHQEGSEA